VRKEFTAESGDPDLLQKATKITKVFSELIRTRQNQPRDSVNQLHFMEIDHQTEGHIQQFHIAYDLSFMNRQNLFYAFQF
jgi:hypothetical protein